MPEVTKLKERRGKARISLDGEFWAEIDSLTVTERGVREGDTLSSDELHEIRLAGERAVAMERSLNLLGYRPRSTRELRQRLAHHGYLEETIETVISRLIDIGYLDDAEFAQSFARGKARKYGPQRVYGDLRRNGIDDETARNAVDNEFSEDSERASAFGAAARRYNVREGSPAQAQRVYGFLMRRGFSAEICAEVAREHRGDPSSGAV